MENYRQLMYGALLHDIGKLVQRADPGVGSHAERGAEFVRNCLPGEEWRAAIECIRYHHAGALQGADLADDSLAYIVYEADNIAAGADRRKRDTTAGPGPFRQDMPLYSIFNVFRHDGSGEETVFGLQTMEESERINFPERAGSVEITPLKYSYLLQKFTKGFREMSAGSDSLESLLKLLEVCLVNVPSSTKTGEMPDISLYNHSKITAMIAGCLYYYLAEQGIRSYREVCFAAPENLRQQKAMLLAAGDISGIQKFIYTISSKGALKSLRGRSFYLEIFLEHVVDEILEACGLCRANLLYSGGGHFYLVLPHTEKVRAVLETAKEKVNAWLIDMYSTELYLEISCVEASAHELANGLSREQKTEDLLGGLFHRVSRSNSLGKLQRYSRRQLEELTDPDSAANSQLEAGRECAVCGSSRHRLMEWDNSMVCRNCLALFKAGDRLARLQGSEQGRPVIVVKPDDSAEQSLPLPALNDEQLCMSFTGVREGEEMLRRGQARRVYSVNSLLTGMNYMTNLWAGTYSADSGNEGLIDFAALAQRSRGIKRIGVLRADVDNLGSAFMRGFVLPATGPGNNTHERYRYVSLSRSASLSYNLSQFFRHEINKLCRGQLGSLEPFRIAERPDGPAKDGKPEKNVVIVYAGGDDVFIVGAWNEVLELAVDLHRAFRKFTNGKMTLSAGVGIFHDSFPVSRMAELTGDLEQAAKNGPKNQISLFGPEITGEGKKMHKVCHHVYRWDDFSDKVCREKLDGLLKWFNVETERAEPGKIKCGLSRLYKLLRLFRGIEDGWNRDERIELARLAYFLGRLEPAGKEKETLDGMYREMKRSLYQWALNGQDRRETITALNLLIYLNRKEEDTRE